MELFRYFIYNNTCYNIVNSIERGSIMKYLITFSYDGSKYYGYQKQPKKKTIQSEIEKALKTINDDEVVSISASGRTDAGVHALNQKAHFELKIKITCDKLKNALNSLIPNDIYVKNVVEVNESFHARYNVRAKEYIYKINLPIYINNTILTTQFLVI